MRIERLIVIADGASWIRDFYSTDLALYDQRRANCQFNGAGIVEKENDLLVARRQKHRGMQWVPNGADVICALRTLVQRSVGDVLEHWLDPPVRSHRMIHPPALGCYGIFVRRGSAQSHTSRRISSNRTTSPLSACSTACRMSKTFSSLFPSGSVSPIKALPCRFSIYHYITPAPSFQYF